MSQVDNLVQFGFSFQSKVVASLLIDAKFLEQVYDILKPNYFDSDANQWIVETIRNYYENHKTTPTLDVFKIALVDVQGDVRQKAIIEALRAATQQYGSTDLDYVKEKFLNFAKNQELKKAILKSVDYLERGEYEMIKNEIDGAMKAGSDRNVGMNYKEALEARISETARSTIETPWDVINDIMDGGIGGGELGVVVANPGAGKTWFLSVLGAHAVQTGKKVLHYTLELNENQVGLRYDSYYSGYGTSEVKYHKDEVQHKINLLKGELRIKEYPTKTATITTLRANTDRLITFGFKPDLIIVDYGDLIKGSMFKGESKKRFELENIYEDLRGWAGEYKIPLWTASQANRSSAEDDIIEGDKISESYSKIMIADFIMSISRKTADKIQHTSRIYIIKNRFGPDGLTFPSKMNASNGNIHIYDEKQPDGMKTKNKMKSGEDVVRKRIGQAINEMNFQKKGKTDASDLG